jgi:hypothetical protein
MDQVIELDFFNKTMLTPYIQELISYDLSGTEGCIHFNGYYYVINAEEHDPLYYRDPSSILPQKMYMLFKKHSKEPCRIEDVSGGWKRARYEMEEERFYYIECHKKVELENTSVYGPVLEENGVILNVCFFPTARQRLYFRVLKVLEDGERLDTLSYGGC